MAAVTAPSQPALRGRRLGCWGLRPVCLRPLAEPGRPRRGVISLHLRFGGGPSGLPVVWGGSPGRCPHTRQAGAEMGLCPQLPEAVRTGVHSPRTGALGSLAFGDHVSLWSCLMGSCHCLALGSFQQGVGHFSVSPAPCEQQVLGGPRPPPRSTLGTPPLCGPSVPTVAPSPAPQPGILGPSQHTDPDCPHPPPAGHVCFLPRERPAWNLHLENTHPPARWGPTGRLSRGDLEAQEESPGSSQTLMSGCLDATLGRLSPSTPTCLHPGPSTPGWSPGRGTRHACTGTEPPRACGSRGPTGGPGRPGLTAGPGTRVAPGAR